MKINEIDNSIYNKVEALEKVKQNGYYLQFMENELKNDFDVVMAAVKQNGHTLQYASDRLKDDKYIILEAVKSYENALYYISQELKEQYGFNAKEFIKNVENEINNTSSIKNESLDYILNQLNNMENIKLEVVKPSSNNNNETNSNDILSSDDIETKKKSIKNKI